MSRAFPLVPATSPWAASLGRLLWLSTVLSPLARRGAFSRLGRFYPWMIAIVHVALFGWSRRSPDVRPAAVVAAAVGLMSWAGGGAVAWGAATDSQPDDRERGLMTIASERGIPRGEQRLARALSTMRVVARAVGLPGASLALVSGVAAPEGHRVTFALALSLSVAVYASLLGVVLGGIARLSALASPRHGRVLFALIVVGPYALPSELGSAPSIVRLFSALLERIASLGGSVG